jgi:hypothetical protein
VILETLNFGALTLGALAFGVTFGWRLESGFGRIPRLGDDLFPGAELKLTRFAAGDLALSFAGFVLMAIPL